MSDNTEDPREDCPWKCKTGYAGCLCAKKKVTPALTPEEWATKTRNGSDPAYFPVRTIKLAEYSDAEGVWNSLTLKGQGGAVLVNHPDLHALAALALHGQPFGFTREDVSDLLWIRGTHPDIDLGERMTSLANRIEALLPPEAK